MLLRELSYRLVNHHQGHRLFAVYAVGENWTGALGTSRLDEHIGGHHDEEDVDSNPLLIFGQNPQAVAVGWGMTALIVDGKLLVSGRPHDFSALLRLRRLPKRIRQYAVYQTLKTTNTDTSRNIDPTSLVGRLMMWAVDVLQLGGTDWETARQLSFLPVFTEVSLPDENKAKSVACSAGLTSVITESSGHVYMFGLNAYGQCGVGYTSNNVWTPQTVTGLNADFANVPRPQMQQSHAVTDVSLGLQHGIVRNAVGEVFCFGKGDRGQLGQEIVVGDSPYAVPIRKALRLDNTSKPEYCKMRPVTQIAAGMIHSAALTDDNQILLWGKHILPRSSNDAPGAIAVDARLPVFLQGLPANMKIESIATGSHHTAVLMEDGSVWAVGVSSDSKEPIHEPIQMIPPGVIDIPVRQFAAHMDRTTIVGKDGRQVLQVHLWKDPELRDYAVFTPAWIDKLFEDPTIRIREAHRSWIHSVVVTD